MYPFWEPVISPLVRAAGARRLVEIGALRGETTEKMLDELGPDAELHVIDPVPAFDPDEHERRFGGRYVFHRGLSLEVLPTLGAVDVALVDGDHNWYTVVNELRLLRESARAEGAPLPMLVLHDVCWPYGRRDLYYAPEHIPEEHRQPYRRGGMRPGRRPLLPKGGLNAQLDNAEHEGGPCNGVMTGLEDFLAEHDRPYRLVVLPIYWGLAIVVDADRLAGNPELVRLLDRLESTEGKDELIRLGESIRLDAAVFEQAYLNHKDRIIDRGIRRYLDVLHAAVALEATIGTTLDRAAQLERILDAVRSEGVAGDLVHVGAGRSGDGLVLKGYLVAHELADRQVFAVDRFRATEGADLDQVRATYDRLGLFDDGVRFLQGEPGDALADAPLEQVAVAAIGPVRADDVEATLDQLLPRMAAGGYVLVDGHDDHAVATAVARARDRYGIAGLLERADWSAVVWRHDGDAVGQAPAPAGRRRAPLLAPTPTDAVDLSVIAVFHDMRREAARTLHSLSRAYQQGIDDLRYEVLVVDNGSGDGQRLDAGFVEGFGAEFRLIEVDDPTSSPTVPMNVGIAASTGGAVALMIDGAHLLSPGVLRLGMLGLRTYEPAIVATQQWYLGPGQQPDAVRAGYGPDEEDGLLAHIEWPDDGYRLFEIGHFIGGRDWFDGIVESNCLFVPRSLLERSGALDDSFDVPGGGYANLELYERLARTPGVTIVSILGEGSFHQVHGGTTTNDADGERLAAKLASYEQHYAEVRGRPFPGPSEPVHYVGALRSKPTRRTRPRRLGAPALVRGRVTSGPDGLPARPVPVPDELRTMFTEAAWNSLAWRTTRWLDVDVPCLPTDLLAYQELLARVRPDWVVETGTGTGGRALFLASVCELLGHGRVVSTGREPDGAELPVHERLTYVRQPADDPGTVAAVAEVLGGPDPNALVVLGSRGRRNQLVAEFEAYSPFVPVGSYVVVEHTVVNGNPVWPGFGFGPHEAVKNIRAAHPGFVPDPTLERFGLTFNPGGYLERRR